MATLTEPGVYTDIPIEDYHADTSSISSSHLKLIHKESAFAYYHEYRAPKPEKDRTKWANAPSRALVIGGATAALMDGGEVFSRGYHVLNSEVAKANKNSKLWKEGYAAAVEASSGQTIILPNEVEQARAVIEAIHHHPDPWTREQLAGLFGSAALVPECSVFHRDEETGLLIKTRPDLGLWDDASQPKICRLPIDIKTTTKCDSWNFGRKINDMGHHIQAAMGIDILNHICHTAIDTWMLIVVEQSEPHDVGVYYLGGSRDGDYLASQSLKRGRQIYRQALVQLAGCLKRDEWPGKSSGIRPISIPAYALKEGVDMECNTDSVDQETGVIR